MNPLILFMTKVALSLAAFYIVYLLFLRRDTMYERNRFFILLSFLASLILPFIIIETRQPVDIQFFGKDLSGMIINGINDPVSAGTDEHTFINWNKIILTVYIAGIIVFSIKLIAEILSLLVFIVRQKNGKNNIIRLKSRNTSGFSAFGYIFVYSESSTHEVDEIIRHEQKHLDRYHFLDIIFLEVIKIIQWFNPFIYLFDWSLREVHEFQADEECLNSGITIQKYQSLILNQVFRTSIFNVSNSFSNPTLIKKRMIMMTKKRSKTLANLKILLVLPVLFLLLISFSTCATKKKSEVTMTEVTPPPPPPPPVSVNDEDKKMEVIRVPHEPSGTQEPEPFVVVEEMPMYEGGEAALLKYLEDNIIYPETARNAGISGRVIIRFCVTETGGADRISVLKGIDPALDAEAMRVVSRLTQFKPGRQGGVAVPVWYMVPVTFSLNEDKDIITPEDEDQKPFAVILETPPGRDLGNEPFVVVEEMPVFPGGDSLLLKYIVDNTHYPEVAKSEKIMGRVIVRFCVTETGDVDRVSVIKGVHPALDKEAIRVISSLPQFEPGKQGGVAVPVWYMTPVTFTLSPSI
jgi:TonB family protein